MIDHLGCYAKVLKYDAVPTLFLPQQVVIKASFDGNIIQEQDTNIKDIIVYNVVDDATFATSNHQIELDLNKSNNITLSETNDTSSVTINKVDDFVVNETNNVTSEDQLKPGEELRLNSIKTQENYEMLLAENAKYRKELEELQTKANNLETILKGRMDALNAADTDYRRYYKRFHSLKNQRRSHEDQMKLLTKVFSESQIKILSGKKKIYWSNDDMAMGYTIRHMSNKRCYVYLTKTLNIPLPALSSIKRWATLKKIEFDKDVKKEDVKEDSD